MSCEQTIFRPPLEPYDVIIHLNPMYVPNRHMGVEVKVREPKRTTQLMKYEIMPVINFNPVISYLKDLQVNFIRLLPKHTECYPEFVNEEVVYYRTRLTNLPSSFMITVEGCTLQSCGNRRHFIVSLSRFLKLLSLDYFQLTISQIFHIKYITLCRRW